MEKKLNLLGIRKKVILCHTKSLAGVTYTVMRPITEQDEQDLDNLQRFKKKSHSIGYAFS